MTENRLAKLGKGTRTVLDDTTHNVLEPLAQCLPVNHPVGVCLLGAQICHNYHKW